MNVYALIVFFVITSFTSISLSNADTSTIIIKPKWRNLEKDTKKDIDFGGKWILVGSITFKKKSKDPIFLESLNFRWHGETLPNLVASLYKKSFSKDFLPIEDNLICDAVWNKSKQMLIFNFDEKETLAPTTTFYLVLTIPDAVEQIITNGSFSLDEHYLPKPFKEQSLDHLSLVINGAASPSALSITS